MAQCLGCAGFVTGVVGPRALYPARRGAHRPSGGSVPYFTCTKLNAFFKYDDALDTFGVHGVGGTMGALVTGFLATPEANPNLNTNLAGIVGKSLWLEQLKAIGLTITMAVVGTVVIALAVKPSSACGPTATTKRTASTRRTTARRVTTSTRAAVTRRRARKKQWTPSRDLRWPAGRRTSEAPVSEGR
jgi:hypothetical protein